MGGGGAMQEVWDHYKWLSVGVIMQRYNIFMSKVNE